MSVKVSFENVFVKRFASLKRNEHHTMVKNIALYSSILLEMVSDLHKDCITITSTTYLNRSL